MKTYGSFFSGGGIADIGAKAAGLELVFANEYDAKIAAVYARNLGDHIRVADIRDEDVRNYPRVNHFHASPVCTRASIANKNRGESQIDIDTARKVCEYIEFHKPDTVTIENVTQYREFGSYKMIISTLDTNGYWHNASNLNSADFGVPQTRRRLIVRAVRGGFVPPLPPAVKPWIGWYEAVADIIDTFEPSEFAPWQLARLPDEMKTFMLNENRTSDAWVSKNDAINSDYPAYTIRADYRAPRAFIVPGGNASSFDIRSNDKPARTVGDTERVGNMPRAFITRPYQANPETERGSGFYQGDIPAPTVMTNSQKQRAFIVDGQPSDNGQVPTIRNQDDPIYTVQSSALHKPARASLSQGRVVKISPRGLARFQSIPDWYELPDNNALACKIIGNGWPSLMAEKILETLL